LIIGVYPWQIAYVLVITKNPNSIPKLFACSLVRGYRIDGAFLPNAVGPAVDLRQSEEMVSLVEVSDEAADFPKVRSG
jgi:hypothetical protein